MQTVLQLFSLKEYNPWSYLPTEPCCAAVGKQNVHELWFQGGQTEEKTFKMKQIYCSSVYT